MRGFELGICAWGVMNGEAVEGHGDERKGGRSLLLVEEGALGSDMGRGG